MPSMKPICLASVMVCALFSTAAAQDSTTAKTSLTITANATGDRVRVTAPASVVQLHLEVYAVGSEKVFDEELRGANVFDWHLQDGQAQRLPAGDYVCVVTAKTISGKLTQKIGSVSVAEKSASVRAGDSQQFTSPQAQAIGPVEADSSWTIVADGENKTTTVIANNGTEGQMIRGRGALSFRLGDFFSGKDQEQMRLTEEGNLGIGTSTPQSKLDVAGTIRAERFLVVKPDKPGSQASADSASTTDSGNSVQPLVSGVGTTGQLTKWTDGASGTLGDSVITETAGGNIGIGTASPGVALDVFTSGASTDLKVRESSRTVDLSSNWTNGISGIGTLTNNKFGLAANGGIRLLLDPSGKVGIGTNSPGVALDVVTAGAATDLQVREASRTVDISSNWTGGTSAIGTTTNNKFGLAANGSIGLTVDTSGNVGIGATNPVKKLDVAGDINTSSDYNISGSRVLSVDGTNNVFAGVNAGTNNTGSENAFFGRGAGFKNTTGNGNSFFGSQAGNQDVEGINNSFFGAGAGFNTIHDSSATGFTDYNSFFGAAAGYANTTGGHNAFFGDGAGVSNTTGGSNAFFGSLAGSLSTGEFDTFVGASAGNNNRNGNYDTLIGSFAEVASGNLNHATAIGAESSVSTSNSISLGRSDGSDTVYVWGVLRTGLDGSGSLDVCRNTDLRLSTCSSSLRYKTGIQPFTRGLDVVRRLRPITFSWKDGGMSDVGFGAEDVEQVEPLLTTRNDQGEIEGVKYKQITTVLVNAIKEQQDQIAALRTANTALNTRLQLIERTLKIQSGSVRRRR